MYKSQGLNIKLRCPDGYEYFNEMSRSIKRVSIRWSTRIDSVSLREEFVLKIETNYSSIDSIATRRCVSTFLRVSLNWTKCLAEEVYRITSSNRVTQAMEYFGNEYTYLCLVFCSFARHPSTEYNMYVFISYMHIYRDNRIYTGRYWHRG